MKKIICDNHRGSTITFTYDFPFFLISADGLYKVEGDVSTTSNAFGIGESYNGTGIPKRPIVITGIIKDNFVQKREILRDMFPLDSYGTLYYYEENIERKIDYIVEDLDVEEKGIPRTFTISLICPYPYFKDIEESLISISSWTPEFVFPIISEEGKGFIFGSKNNTTMGSIENTSNIEVGMTIHFIANGEVKNPYLVNVETQEKITIDTTMKRGDEIIITTHRNNRNILYYEEATGKTEDRNYLLGYGSKFLQVHSGKNTLRAGAEMEEENLITKIFYSVEYEAC